MQVYQSNAILSDVVVVVQWMWKWTCCGSYNTNSTYCMNTAYCDGCDRTGGHYQRCSQYAEKEEDGGGPLVQEPLKSSSVSAEEGKEGKEDRNDDKEGSVLGAAVPRKELPVDEEAEAEARQKAKHTGSWVRRMHQRAGIVVRCVVYKVV